MAVGGVGVTQGGGVAVSAARPPAPVPAGINVNTATKAKLTTLSGVGPALAQAIIDGRPWTSVNDLASVRGISQAMIDGWEVAT